MSKIRDARCDEPRPGVASAERNINFHFLSRLKKSRMLHFAWLLVLVGCFVPFASAQEHGQIGVYGDYFHMPQTHSNFVGLGGRLSVNTGRALQWEAEMSYDFQQSFTETFSNGVTTSFQNTDFRILHGLFGPKLQTTRGPVRVFLTAKGGFINFRFDPRGASFSTFASSVEGLRTNDVSGVFYPGGGIEGHLGPIGLRLDVGDEMYFNGPTHHNLRVSFGPIIRF
jgi:hypothetical protein